MLRKYLFIALLFTAAIASGQEVDLSKRISLEGENLTIEQIIREIAAQGNFYFAYSKKSINAGRKISLIADNTPVKDVLQQLEGIAGIQYSVVEQQIVLKPRKQPQKERKKSTPKRHTLSGFIRDAQTGETLIGTTIYIRDSGQGTIANEYGFFSLSMPAGKYDIEVSHIGYDRLHQTINLVTDRKIYLALSASPTSLPAIILTNSEQSSEPEHYRIGKQKLLPSEMKNIPEFGGEVGLVKSLQTLPGIKTHSDGSAYFFVRGGNKDQNLILIDDAPVYNHSHLFGFYSIFIPDFTKSITIYKSDIPVNQGDRLASLIDIRTKDGNLNKWGLMGIFNPLVSTIAFEGPIRKEKSSIFASIRHSNFKWLYKERIPELNLYFLDFNFKFNTKINDKNRLYFTAFRGTDVVDNVNILSNGRDGIEWTNGTSTIRWNHIFNDKLFLNSLVYASAYQYIFRYNDILWTSAITNASLKFDFADYVTPDLTLRFGFNQNIHAFNPGSISRSGEVGFLPTIPKNQSREKVLYFNANHHLTERLSYNAGFRIPIWSNFGPTTAYRFDKNYQVTDTLHFGGNDEYESFFSIDPRLSLRYALNDKAAVKVSFGRYHQFMQLLSNSTTPFTSLDVWIPSGANTPPQEAKQFSLGYYHTFDRRRLEFRTEAYYKKMNNQIDYKPHANMLLNPLVEGELRLGDAWSYGLELFLKKTTGRLSGWAAYTYSRTYRQTPGINNGKRYPAFYDRPHDFSVYLSYRMSERANISANWVFNTGSAISTPVGFYEYNNQTIPIYGDKNNDRLPNYHRLDVALNIKLNKRKRKSQHELNLSIYNLYARRNPISLNFNKVLTANGKFVVPSNVFGTNELESTQTILLRFMPSLTYKFKI